MEIVTIIKFMSNFDVTLKEFVSSIPTFQQRSGLDKLIDLASSNNCETIAILDRRWSIAGVINCDRLLRLLAVHWQEKVATSAATVVKNLSVGSNFLSTIDFEEIIEPAHLVSSETKVREFLSEFQSSALGSATTGRVIAPADRTIYLVIEPTGTLLGLLDTQKLLRFLVSTHSTEKSSFSSATASITASFCDLIEKIPLPLILQTDEGKTVYQNRAWQESFNPVSSLVGINSNNSSDLSHCYCLKANQHLTPAVNSIGLSSPNLNPHLRKNHAGIDCEHLLDQRSEQIDRTRTFPDARQTAPSNSLSSEDLQVFQKPQTDSSPQNSRSSKLESMPASLSSEIYFDSAPDIDGNSTQSSFTSDYLQSPFRNWAGADSQIKFGTGERKTQFWRSSSEGVGETEVWQRMPVWRPRFANHPPSSNTPSPPTTRGARHNWQYLKLPVDLTEERARAQSNLPRHWLILAVKFNELQSDAKNARDAELIQLNRLKDRLLANISHELKSPLTGIVGLSNLLKEKKLGELNQRQVRYVNLIHHSGCKLMTIVNKFLDFSSLATGKLELNLEPIEIKSLWKRIYQQVTDTSVDTQEISITDFDFQLQVQPESEIVTADKARLSQILSYLLEKALKSARPESQITFCVSSVANWLTMTVKYNSLETTELKSRLDGVYPLKEQSCSSDYVVSASEQDSDLEAMLARQLAKAHGGDISIISRGDRGGEYTLLLPLDASLSNPKITISDRQISNSDNQLVLLVETNPRDIDNITGHIKELDYYPLVASTGTEALSKARQFKPSLILLNPSLPLLSGEDVLTLLKSDARTKDIPLFILGIGQEVRDNWQLYQQAEGLIYQPIDRVTLAQILPVIKYNSIAQKTQKQNLTILCLYPESKFIAGANETEAKGSSFNLKDWAERDWTEHGDLQYGYHHRIIEADSLEQAHMLARIWQLDVIVLDGSKIEAPQLYLQSLKESPYLASLPLVTLDAKTTAAANQVGNLNIYPCLVPAEDRSIIELMQVIQIAAGLPIESQP